METSESIKSIATALAKAQASMHGATKDRKNPAFKSEYATLSSVVEAARGPLTENGIAFIQSPGAIEDAGIPVTTTLMHSSGEWLRSRMVIPVRDRNNPQAVGSAVTYACRYSLMAMLGLPPVDDDGVEAAQGSHRPVAAPQRRPEPAQEPAPSAEDASIAKQIEEAFDSAETPDDLEKLRHEFEGDIAALPEALKQRLRRVYGLKKKVLVTFADPPREAAE